MKVLSYLLFAFCLAVGCAPSKPLIRQFAVDKTEIVPGDSVRLFYNIENGTYHIVGALYSDMYHPHKLYRQPVDPNNPQALGPVFEKLSNGFVARDSGVVTFEAVDDMDVSIDVVGEEKGFGTGLRQVLSLRTPKSVSAVLGLAKANRYEAVSRLLENNNEILLAEDSDGLGLMQHAIANNDSRLIRLLRQRKADSSGIVQWAVEHGYRDGLKTALEAGLPVYGGHPVDYAVEHGDQDVVALLLDHCPKWYINEGQFTPIYTAIRNDNVRMAEFLLSRGADLNHQDGIFQHSPLTYAIDQNKPQMVKWLLSKGVRRNVHPLNEPPVYLAAKSNSEEIAKLLIQAGFDVNELGEDQFSPLIVALTKRNTDLARMLVNAGANLNAMDKNGATVYCYAKNYGAGDIEAICKKAGAVLRCRN